MIDLDSLNTWAADVWLPWLLRGGVQATLVALVVALAWLCLRRRASAHLGAALLLLPWIPLVAPLPDVLPIALPVELPRAGSSRAPDAAGPGPRSRAPELGPALAELGGDLPENTEAAAHPNVGADSARGEVAVPETTVASAGTDPRRLPLLALALWACGLLLGVARFAAAQARTRRLIDEARPVRDPRARHLLRRAAAEARLPATPRLLESNAVASPAAWGLLRPTVLLPVGFAERVDDSALGWTLHHELAHLARRDLFTAALVRLLRAAFWFHPVAWWLERSGAELRECACDEVALATLPELPRRRAAEALLDVIEAARVAGPRRLALESLHSDRNRLEKRLMRLIDTNRAHHLRLTPAAALALALTAGLGFATTQLTPRAPRAEVETAALAEAGRDETRRPAVTRPTAATETELAGAARDADDVPPAPEAGSPVRPRGSARPEAAGRSEPRGGALARPPQEPTAEPEEEVLEIEEDPYAEARAAVARARDYLLTLQRDDGRWETGNPKKRFSGEFSDVGVTALAVDLLRTSERAEHRDAAARGLRWLAGQQDPESGMFGLKDSFCYMPSHAVATTLWFDAHPDGLNPEQQEVARKAMEFLFRSRNPYGGWRYESPPVGDNDSFITSLCLSAIARARDAGLEIDRDAIHDPRRYLDEVTDPDSGRVGYLKLGGPPPRLVGKQKDFPVKYSEYPTASTIVAYLDLGDDPVEEDGILAAAAVVARVVPRWDPVEGTNDAYHWLWGTRALRPLGGVMWQRWRRGLFEALVPNQRASGDWPLQDAWSGQNDRAHIAAVYGLALQEALRD